MATIRSVISGVLVAYLLAIGLTLLIGFVGYLIQQSGMLPDTVTNVFLMVYQMTRALVLFIVVFPLALSLIVGSFFIDLFVEFGSPILNEIAIFIGLNKDMFPTEAFAMKLVTAEKTGLIPVILDLIDTILPETF